MGKRGPTREPTPLKIVKGTYRSDRHGDVDAEAQPDAALTAPPEWLDGVALEIWEDIAPRLLRLGLFSELDSNTLAQYCEAWADFHLAKET